MWPISIPNGYPSFISFPLGGQGAVKAIFLIRQNVAALLAARHETQTALAQWVGHKKSWINKFLNEGREVQLKDLDRIAAFFGIETYQLFQPGISRLTERRSQIDRRVTRERRIGHTGRLLSTLQQELNKVPHLASSGVPHGTGATVSVPAAVKAIIAHAEQQIAAFYAEAQLREQTPTPRRKVTPTSQGRRNVRGSDPKTA